MSAWPAVAEAAVAVLLVGGMVRAYGGAPPARRDPVAAAAWTVAGALLTVTALLAHGDGPWRLALTAGAVVCGCAAGWWLRVSDDGGDDPAAAPDGPPAPDWDEFDRLRGTWERPRAPLAR